MSTLAEIESAAESLSRPDREELLAFLAKSLLQPSGPASSEDPVEEVIGAFAGQAEGTGRHAEEILYGRA
jgi:hypothetical protein